MEGPDAPLTRKEFVKLLIPTVVRSETPLSSETVFAL